MSHAIIIGAGIGGMATACLLGKAGYKVTVLEKNEQLGGRASQMIIDGFTFDMGPSWYLMPEFFEHFFKLLDERVEDHLSLTKLAPSYRVFFAQNQKPVDIFSDLKKDLPTLEKLEPGITPKFLQYLKESRTKYTISKKAFIYRNYNSVFDFFNWRTMILGSKLSAFGKMKHYVEKFFKTTTIQKIIQYPLVFLGSEPGRTPALYSLMTAVDFDEGVYYPAGGIKKIIDAMEKVAKKYDVTFHLNTEVASINATKNTVNSVTLSNNQVIEADLVICNTDRHFCDTVLMPTKHREYTNAWWNRCTLSPSAYILYLGIEGNIENLTHHNLYFCEDWDKNFTQIYDQPQWPDDPSFYMCAPSKTDASAAPKNHENLFILVPIAPGLKATKEELDKYENSLFKTIEEKMNISNFKNRIKVKKQFFVPDFEKRFHSFGGSALGLAHTLNQTAVFRPNTKHKKLKNMYFVGADTNPGIGMPMCLVSAELVYKQLINNRSSTPLSSL